jgi:hypothetical protein
MLSDISIGGVFLPRLLVSAFVALLLLAVSSRLFASFGLYRLFAYPPLVNMSIFAIWLGLLASFMYGN